MIDTAPVLSQINEKCCAAFINAASQYNIYTAALFCTLLLYFDPLVDFLRTFGMNDKNNTVRTPAAINRVSKALKVLRTAPQLLFGVASWACGTYWLLAMSGLA